MNIAEPFTIFIEDYEKNVDNLENAIYSFFCFIWAVTLTSYIQKSGD